MTELPEPVRRKLEALGPAGRRWVADLDDLVGRVEARWDLTVGVQIGGGSGAFVARAVTGAGAEVVVKIAIPDGLEGHGSFDSELRALRLGDGRGYVRVLHADVEDRVMVLEGLGRSLAQLRLPVGAQVDALVETLLPTWRRVPDPDGFLTGAAQAVFLRRFVRDLWTELGGPCPEAVVRRAEQLAAQREAAFDPSTAVLVHGDAHPANVLEDGGGRFKLIDPEGLLSEPAHDLAIGLRDWTDELLAGDPVADAVAWCGQLADRAGVDERAIWEWAFVERVSTGLFLLQLGDPQGGRFLEVAERWLDAGP
ncbi:MAG: phosphotransferase [Acidimicrobiia bacterium]|nr:phosphotransferase [Acidimicrobiia bacterium]